MNQNIEYLSQQKFDELKKELETLKTIKRKEITESLEFAKSLGDLSENAEYQEAREMQVNVEQRISELETMLKDAIILSENSKDLVCLGSTVTVLRENEKEEKEFMVVGSEESNVAIGKISNISPIGSALMGKKEGDTISVLTPGGVVKYQIKKIK